ncbi:MAG: DUF1801 domain-containing protein [Anaeroplasmataceae bacterium]|nr:DUF1801 domain-containing protein [Anaeroplasmataceae bacterium]
MIEEKLNKFPVEIKNMFSEIRGLVFKVAPNVIESLWAGLPSYSVSKEKFVRIIPFKDHINIEALALKAYKDSLEGYIFTTKNMLQIFVGDTIPKNILLNAFKETLAI